MDLRREGSKGNLEVSLTTEDVVAIMVFNRKSCFPHTKQDHTTNFWLKSPQGDFGKLASLVHLKTDSLVFYLII